MNAQEPCAYIWGLEATANMPAPIQMLGSEVQIQRSKGHEITSTQYFADDGQ